jgi:hypothetical protein
MLHSLSALQTFGSWMWDCLGLYLLGETEHVKNEGNEATGCLTFLCTWVWSCLKMTIGLFDILVHVSWSRLPMIQWVVWHFVHVKWSWLKMIWWGVFWHFFCMWGTYFKIKLWVIWHFCACEWHAWNWSHKLLTCLAFSCMQVSMSLLYTFEVPAESF